MKITVYKLIMNKPLTELLTKSLITESLIELFNKPLTLETNELVR